MTLGEKIKAVREEHGFRIQEFAVALQTSPRVVERLENNEFKNVRQRWIQAIASLTGQESGKITEGRIHFYDPARQAYVIKDEDINVSE